MNADPSLVEADESAENVTVGFITDFVVVGDVLGRAVGSARWGLGMWWRVGFVGGGQGIW